MSEPVLDRSLLVRTRAIRIPLTQCAAAAAVACATLILTPLSAHAEEEAPVEQHRVEIVGVTPVPGLGVPKDQVPANVQTARASDLERGHAIDLSSFMARKLGSVHVNEIQNNPLQPDINYRGFTASPLLGTQQGLSVYVDGVRLNQPFGDVVSWDLIPKAAIATIALMPGSNPLFGLNTLGGALSVQTKDGLTDPGTSVQLVMGSHKRAAIEFETGGSRPGSIDWFVTGNRFHDKGWRVDSPSEVRQLFGKLGLKTGDGRFTVSMSAADNDLNGNGLQELRLLASDYHSVYTKPDINNNRALLINLAGTQKLGSALSVSGNAYWRRLRSTTYNGDLNDDALDQSVYQPNAAERAALTAGGYSGFPTSGETAANTPFPKWRCIAQALLRDEPAEKCNGVINTGRTAQTNVGLSAQVEHQGNLGAMVNRVVVGAAVDVSRVQFNQGSELGYLAADRSVIGVGAFGDGVSGGDVDGAPYDTRVDLSGRTRTWSVFASDTLALNPQTHLTISGRYNRTKVKNRDAITPGGGPGSLDGDHSFSRLNPAIGLTFAASNALTAYAGFNQGSRAPSAIELGCADPAAPCKLPNAMVGDPPLKQVVTSTIEAGLRSSVDGTSWNIGIFRADNKDDIMFVADDQAGFGYFKNFGKTRRQGLEAGFATRLGQVALGANYSFIAATYRSNDVVNGSSNSSNSAAAEGFPGVDGTIAVTAGKRIPLIPRHLLKLFAEVNLSPDWSVGADLSGVGGSYARGNENNAHQPDGRYYLGPGRNAGYAVLNFSADWRPTDNLKIFLQINNVLDRKYSTASQLNATGLDANGNFVSRPFAASANGDRPLVHSTFFAPGAPRSFMLGVRYSFGE